MKRTLETINQMQRDGVIGKYAIGGAIGAIFYLETFYTEDLDVFVSLPTVPGSGLLSLAPIYEYLVSKNCEIQGERILIGSWPVQFLAPNAGLEQEALDEAREIEYEGVRTFIFGAEYLVAIALRTGRAKDYARIAVFLDQDAVDRKALDGILFRYDLAAVWKSFEDKYLKK